MNYKEERVQIKRIGLHQEEIHEVESFEEEVLAEGVDEALFEAFFATDDQEAEQNRGILPQALKQEALLPFSFQRDKVLFLWAFIIPIALLSIVYAFMGVFPIGDRSIFTVDLYNQYAPFLYSYRDRLLNFESIFYSLHGGLGLNYFSLWAYYLASPFNLLLLPFSEKWLPLGITFLSLFKTGLMSCAMLYFLRRGFTEFLSEEARDEIQFQRGMSLLVAIVYAMNSFVLAYSWNLMWMDALIFLPLILLGITKLIQEGKSLLYVSSLVLCILSNYYAAFFVCIFSGLYFIYFFFVNRNGYTIRKSVKKRHFFLRFFQYILMTASALGMSFALLYPVAKALKSTSAIRDSFPPRSDFLFTIGAFFERFFIATAPHIRSGLPNIFTSLLTYFALGAYLLLPSIKWREKLATFTLWCFLCVSLGYNMLNFMWHGLHYPNQIPHRFAFVLVFLHVFILYRVLSHWKFLPFKWVLPLFSVQIFVFIGYYFLQENKINQAFPFAFYLNVFFLIAYLFYMFASRYAYLTKQHLVFLLVMTVIVELFLQALISFDYISRTDYYGSYKSFVEHIEEVDRHKDFVRGLEGSESFYRMEVYPKKTSNDPSIYRLPGLSTFSSTNAHGMTKTMRALGYFSNGLNSYVQEQQTPVMDMLLGMKYLVREKNLGRDISLEEVILPQVSDTKASHHLYRRLYTLPLGYQVEKTALDYSRGKEEVFREQEAFVQALTGFPFDRKLFEALELEEVDKDQRKYVELVEYYLPDKGFKLKLEKPSDAPSDAEAQFSLNVKAEESGQHYLYVYTSWKANTYEVQRLEKSEEAQDVLSLAQDKDKKPLLSERLVPEISLAQSEERKTNSGPTLLDLGYIEAGREVKVTIKTKKLDGQSYSIWAKRLSEKNFEFIYDKLMRHPLDLNAFKAGAFSGKVQMSKNAYLFLSIPYDRSWNFYANGERVEAVPMGEAFTLLPLDKGEYEIQAEFIPEALPFALKVSGASFVFFIFLQMIFYFIHRAIERKYEQEESLEAEKNGENERKQEET